MLKFVFRRIINSIPIIILVMILSFLIIHIMPGDPVRTMLGDKASEEQIINMRKQLNLDKPLMKQFTIWIKDIIRFDFGESISWKEPTLIIIKERIEPTFLLAIIGTLLSTLIGIPLGILSAKQHGKLTEKCLSVLSLVSISLPAFWIAIIMIQLFGVNIRIFPVSGFHSIKSVGLLASLYELSLPGIILGIMHSGQIGRMTKTSMLEVMQQDYLRTARAKGVKEFYVLNLHGLKNALSSIVVVIGFSFASLLGGAIVIEQIFNIPGVGNLAINSILSRDYPLIQGILLFIALIFILINMLTDIICALINPKVRYDHE